VILAEPTQPNHDVDYLFGQVSIDKPFVDWSGNCGNLTAAVGAFAINSGFVAKDRIPENGTCTVRIWQANIKKTIVAHVPITNGEVQTTVGAIRVLKGGTLVTGLSFSIDQSGQGAGEVYQSTATGANTVSEGDAVQIAWDKMGDAEINANEADACVMIEFVPA